jgi:ABC-type multidrug transport system fused ATPase/permease subunit
VAALAAVPLQFQKDIINGLDEMIEQHQLVMLCAGYLAVLVMSSGLKFALQYKSSTLSESVIRRIRETLYRRRTAEESTGDERGTLVTMIAAEAEEVGQFAGAAIASPLMQLGTLFSVIAYITATQPFLGLILVAVIVPQIVIVLTLQRHINDRIGKLVKILRHATGMITAAEVSRIQQDVLDKFDEIYETHRQVFMFKLSMKFALNIINGLGTVGILLLGGVLVLNGKTDIGSVVASLSALARIIGPWKELIAFYRELSAVRVKFELLINT